MPQALAWLIGAGLWVACTLIIWLARGRSTQPQPVAEIPGDISPHQLTRPLILFAVIRAAAVSIAVAITFGLALPDAYWMPIAALIAMKPDLQQSALIAEQRLAGAIVGAAVGRPSIASQRSGPRREFSPDTGDDQSAVRLTGWTTRRGGQQAAGAAS